MVTNPIAETQLVFVLGLLSFYIAEGATLSGIISSFCSGIFMGMYADRNLSKAGRTFTHGFLETVSALADIIIFFKIGMSAFTNSYNANFEFAFFSLFLCLVGRAAHIFPFSYLMNLNRVQKIPLNHQVMMFHSGLRGAIAFSLSLDMDTDHRGELVFATMLIAICTVFGFGCTTGPMLNLLKIDVGIDSTDNSCFSVHDKKRRGLLKIHKNILRPFLLRKDVIDEKETMKLEEYENDETITNLRTVHPEIQVTVHGLMYDEAVQDTKFRSLLDQIAHADENQSTINNLKNFLRRKKQKDGEDSHGEREEESEASTPRRRRRRLLRRKQRKLKREISPASVTRFHKPETEDSDISDQDGSLSATDDSVGPVSSGHLDVRSVFPKRTSKKIGSSPLAGSKEELESSNARLLEISQSPHEGGPSSSSQRMEAPTTVFSEQDTTVGSKMQQTQASSLDDSLVEQYELKRKTKGEKASVSKRPEKKGDMNDSDAEGKGKGHDGVL